MKILIAAIVLTVFGQQAWAELNLDTFQPAHKELSETRHIGYVTRTVCIHGYKFVVASKGESVSITQFYKRQLDKPAWPPVPAECRG